MSASYANKPGVRALEVAGEHCLGGRPLHRFVQESLYPRVHVASLHGPALIDKDPRDGVDEPAVPWMRGERRPRPSESASSCLHGA